MHKYQHITVALLFLLQSSCSYVNFLATVPPTKIMPADTPCKTDYVMSTTYRLQSPVFVVKLMSSDKDLLPDFEFIPENFGGHPDWPETLAEYERFDHTHWHDVVGVLPVGAVIKFREMRIISGFENSSANPLFSVQDGPLSKLGLINGYFISDTNVDTTVPANEAILRTMIDPKFMK